MRLISALVSFLLAGSAFAQVRVAPAPSSFVNPVTGSAAQLLFGPNGYFTIAGGVVLGGTAAFYLERNGIDQPVAAAALRLAAGPEAVSITYGGLAYQVGMPAALACPLGQFVARDGIVAYTVPKYLDDGSRRFMLKAGLRHHRVAREFDGTRFEPLLRAADFAATTPLPPPLARDLTAGINSANDLAGFVIEASDETNKPIGSLLNTDLQVRYRVYLLASTRRVEIAGVPLRYYWQLDRGGAAGVFAVDVFAQDWPSGAGLTDLAAPGARPTQYDIVNFYQVAGLFRQLHLTDPAGFEAFLGQACTAGNAQQ